MSNFDRFESDYHNHRFPDIQDNSRNIEYSTCSGCEELITEHDVLNNEVLDVYGMSVHDTYDCLKKAVEAKYAILERND
ncbi:hypothetical protein ACH6EH_07465 [Paenibacillus sp. JSM ZJ436]|uniref:hypothetical protein n=1 Tax=Paenibacillus sp. JSM ZJ436 TaxID=3376190 RepID=UPI0037BE086B